MFAEFLEVCRNRYGVGDANTSMAEWICANTTLKKQPFSFQRYPFQRQIADDMHPDMTVEKCSQIGLALSLDTPIPTNTGWTTMGEVQVGDVLFDEAGQPCTVTYTSPVWLDRPCFRVTFDDGTEIVADAEHRWPIEGRGNLTTHQIATGVGPFFVVATFQHSPRQMLLVEPVPSVPTRCLTVNSPSHLFLASRSFIPTHNTEVQLRKFFAILTRNEGVSGIFTLPSERMYKRIYSGRMAPMLQSDAVFNPQMAVTPVRRNDLIQIRDSFGYITGCTESDATSISADFLFHDEYDLSPKDIIGLFPSRLQGSEMAITQSFSTPSYFDVGINRAYKASDQHEYLVKCGSCNHWNLPKFEFAFLRIPNLPIDLETILDLTPDQISGLDFTEAKVVCEHCHRALDLSSSSAREWVAKYPGRVNQRGYKVRPFSTGRLSIGHILGRLAKAKINENLRGFHNTVLGDPFTAGAARIQRHQVEAVMSDNPNPPDVGDAACFLGVDMGQICHMTVVADIDGQLQFVFFDTCHVSQLSERLADLSVRYRIIQGCVDRHPYTPTVDALRVASGGLIMPVEYRGTAPLARKRDELDEVTHYQVNRTMVLDKVKTLIAENMTVIAGYGSQKETLITHLGDMIREERPEQEPVWEKIDGNDHYFHAMAFALIAPRISEDHFVHSPGSAGEMVVAVSAKGLGSSHSLLPQGTKRKTGLLG